jgi:hypothetical protein
LYSMFMIVWAGSSVWYERLTCTQEDGGSNPPRSTILLQELENNRDYHAREIKWVTLTPLMRLRLIRQPLSTIDLHLSKALTSSSEIFT